MGDKEGKGKSTLPDGSTYDGEWNQNKLEGYGTQLWADGRQYRG